MKCGDNRYRPFEFRSAGLVIEDQPKSISGLIWEVDLDAKETGRPLSRRDHFEQVARDLQDFAYAVSHDLQAPMRQVQSAVSELREQEPESASEVEAAAWSVVRTKSAAMQRMLKCLLEYSRVHTHGSTFSEVDIESLVADAIRLHGDLIESRSAKIEVGKLPTVRCDGIQIARLMWHLIDNALKYSQRDPKIEISAKQTQQGWLLSVVDNGTGIAAKYHRSAFIIFRRLQLVSGIEGDGFGLALSKRIAERHGGRMWIESNGKDGSTAFVLLPS
ncbi:MAG: ATP-binding protein [Planctomycetaceae bacterium]